MSSQRKMGNSMVMLQAKTRVLEVLPLSALQNLCVLAGDISKEEPRSH